MKPQTPSQTVGPFFHPSFRWAISSAEVTVGEGESLVAGTITDGKGDIISTAVLEIWQPHAAASPRPAVARGFQRVFTEKDGRFVFTVTDPPEGPAFAHVTVFSLGLMGALRTRAYVRATPDDLKRVDELRHVPDDRLPTLIAAKTDQPHAFWWPVRLQGEGETVFFSIDLTDSSQTIV